MRGRVPEPALYHSLARFYDRIYAGREYRAEANELLEIARRTTSRRPRTLLDVACGTGAHLSHVRNRVAVAGVDSSPSMLAVARRRLGRAVPLRLGDMRSFDLRRRFDVVTCMFSAIAYLPTSRDRVRAFRNFYRHLVPGGVALVEGWILPHRWKGRLVSLMTYAGPEAKVARMSASSRHGNWSHIDMEYLIGEPGKPIVHVRESHDNPLVTAAAMLRDLRRAGFHARVVLSGRYRDRGLYVAQRPAY